MTISSHIPRQLLQCVFYRNLPTHDWCKVQNPPCIILSPQHCIQVVIHWDESSENGKGRLFFGRFRKNSLKKNSPISKNSLIFAETHGKKDPETEISANFSYLTMIPAMINLRKNEFSSVLLTITTWSLKNSLMKKKLTTFFPKNSPVFVEKLTENPKNSVFDYFW